MSFARAFQNDPRYQQEQRARPLIDAVYTRVFNCKPESITRYNGNFLDRSLGLYVGFRLHNGMVLRGQEKALSFAYSSYASLTVEYEQDQHTQAPGDWFSLAAQFYFCGYLNPLGDAFCTYALVNWPALVLATTQGRVLWQQNRNQDGKARASFRYVQFKYIPHDCLIDTLALEANR